MTATLYALKKHGLSRNDVTLLGVGGTPERRAALRTGRIQATVLSAPTSFAAERESYQVLPDVICMPLPYNSVSSTRMFIRQNPETARRFVKAHLEAVHLLKTNRETGIKTLAKYLRRTRTGLSWKKATTSPWPTTSSRISSIRRLLASRQSWTVWSKSIQGRRAPAPRTS
ncbi:MAG: ABC transporter substrate-binding protein [Candidatus Binatia bacterium]